MYCISSFSYIKPQPQSVTPINNLNCISSFSYIKPQRTKSSKFSAIHCISSFSYIKPQLYGTESGLHLIVYHPFPTSNHNLVHIFVFAHLIVYHPFPTSNHNFTTPTSPVMLLYIILFLHQTTTVTTLATLVVDCISSFSYIKPQPSLPASDSLWIVYHPFPTSNHNYAKLQAAEGELYIILFLHQTTTSRLRLHLRSDCISSFSYIKPQPASASPPPGGHCISSFSYIKPQLLLSQGSLLAIVYHPFPTSNHNIALHLVITTLLYIILFLHQTTTSV